jgi:hypothetical protein
MESHGQDGHVTERGTGILPVESHGQDGHVTGRGTGILPVESRGQDGHVTERGTGAPPVNNHGQDAHAATSNGVKDSGNIVIDAVGPEIYTFEELTQLIAGMVGSRAKIVHMPPSVALFLSRLVGMAVHDVILTRDEVAGLMAGLLVSKSAPTCRTRLSEWVDRHAHLLGRRYASELDRHFRDPGKARATTR